MRKFQRKVITVASLVLVGLFLASSAALAQVKASPTPEPEVESESSPSGQLTLDTTEKLKARIEKIVEERRNQIMGALNEIGRTRKGFIGEVQRVSAETITIKTSKGPQILSLTDDVMMTKKGRPITVEAVTVGDWAMVIGLINDDIFTPELITISSESLKPKTQKVMLGTITDIKKNTLVVKHRSQDQEEHVTTTKQSEFLDSESNVIDFKTLKPEMQVLVVAQQGSNNLELSSLKLLSAIGGAR